MECCHGMKTQSSINNYCHYNYSCTNKSYQFRWPLFAPHHAMCTNACPHVASTASPVTVTVPDLCASLHPYLCGCRPCCGLACLLRPPVLLPSGLIHSDRPKNCFTSPIVCCVPVCGWWVIRNCNYYRTMPNSVHNQHISSIAKSNYYFVYSSQ